MRFSGLKYSNLSWGVGRTSKLMELAKVIRSKNSSIYHVTVDIIFDKEENYKLVRDSGAITHESVADLYGISVDRVVNIISFDPGKAIKVNLRRVRAAGDPGEHDVFGSQYNDPLFDLEIPLPIAEVQK